MPAFYRHVIILVLIVACGVVTCPGKDNNSTHHGHEVMLNWQQSESAGARYNVYRAAKPEGPYTRLNSTPLSGLTFTDRNVAPRQTWFYEMRAVGPNGKESIPCKQVKVVVPRR